MAIDLCIPELTSGKKNNSLLYFFYGVFLVAQWSRIPHAGDPGLIPGLGNPLEKGMATHSSILTWEISWTEEPSGLQSMGSQSAGHDLGLNNNLSYI